jgi:casein kinase 1
VGGLIHRDVKPENILYPAVNMQRLDHAFLIDFGLAKEIRPHKFPHTHQPFVGTPRFASLNALRGIEQSRPDDLEGLAYTLIHLVCGSLPYTVNIEITEGLHALLAEKEAVNTQFCADLPTVFVEFLKEVQLLGFSDIPDYQKYERVFRQEFEKMKEHQPVYAEYREATHGAHGHIPSPKRVPVPELTRSPS